MKNATKLNKIAKTEAENLMKNHGVISLDSMAEKVKMDPIEYQKALKVVQKARQMPIYINKNTLLEEKIFDFGIRPLLPVPNYRSFKNLSDFSNEAIFNILNSYGGTNYFTDVRNLKFEQVKSIIIFRDMCIAGDLNAVLIINAQKNENETYSDVNNGICFDLLNRIFEAAQVQGCFKISTETMHELVMKANQITRQMAADAIDRHPNYAAETAKIPSNVMIGAVVAYQTCNQDFYKNLREINILCEVAKRYPQYIFYANCDAPKADLILYLSSLGYTQIYSNPQDSPDLAIIDMHNKRYMFFEIKNCTIYNFERFVDQYCIIEMGNLSLEDQKELRQFYRDYNIQTLSQSLNSNRFSSAERLQIQSELQQLKKDFNHNVDPMTGTQHIFPILLPKIDDID